MSDHMTHTPADAWGAVDLSQTPGAPSGEHRTSDAFPASSAAAQHSAPAVPPATGEGTDGTSPDEAGVPLLDIPLIRSADENSFEEVASTSRALPVVIALWSARSLDSQQLVGTMEELARQYAGAFQLVGINVDTAPAVAQAFQIQAVPTVVALVGGRPVPLFQGAPARESITPVLDELLQAAGQMGVVARIRLSDAEMTPPIPEEHLPALDAEERGDFEQAERLWAKVVELNPRDEDAKSHLARVRLIQRSENTDQSDPAAQADVFFAQGRHEEAFAVLLDLIARTRDEERDAVRVRLLDLFRVAGNSDEVRAARLRLSTLLMV